MIPLFVYLSILMTIIVAVAGAVYSYQRSSETVSLAQRNAARMEQVGYSIRTGLRPALMNGRMLVPLGDPDGPPIAVRMNPDGKTAANPSEQVCVDGLADYAAGKPSPAFNQNCRRMGVPRWLVSDDRTPWGGSYAFCPYALDPFAETGPAAPATTAGLVRTGGGDTTYRVRSVMSRGRPYVLQSDSQSIQAMGGDVPPVPPTTVTEEIIGFVLSPPPHVRDKAPRCQDVAKVDGSWIVLPTAGGASDGSYPGSVVPVTSRGIGVGQVANQGEVVIYAAEKAYGIGSGDRDGDAIAFKDALDLWHLTPWRSTTILVKGAAGPYGFGPGDTVPGGSASRLAITTGYPGRVLRIGSSDGQPVVISNTAGGVLDLALGVDATLDSVSLAAGIQLRPLEGSNVAVTNGALHHVRVDGGDLSLGTGTGVAADPAASPYTGIDVISGRLRLSGGGFAMTGAVPVGIQVLGGDLVLNGTDLSVQLSPGGQTVSTASAARVSVAPKANGSWPTVSGTSANGTMSRILGAEIDVFSTSSSGSTGMCSSVTGTCVAQCVTPEEASAGLSPSRIANQGSCAAGPQPPQEDGKPSPVESRPSLVTAARGDMAPDLAGAMGSGSWACGWRPGQVYTMSTLVNGGVYAGYAAMPALTASAHCVPNPRIVVP